VSSSPRQGGVALALSGGAALGWAHLGVLDVLAQAGVRVVAVAGTSMGAIAAAGFAAGRLQAVTELALGAKRLRVARHLDLFGRGGGLIGGAVIERTLTAEFGAARLQALGLPCAVMAVDVASGEPIVLREGPAVEAVMASIAIPGVIAPVRIGGRLLVDGGVADPVPVRAARALAARPVVAVNVLADWPARARHLRLADQRANRSLAQMTGGIALLMRHLVATRLAIDAPDLVIEPAVGRFSPAAFHRADELIAAGREAALVALPKLHALAETP
jgi:NTE family protein